MPVSSLFLFTMCSFTKNMHVTTSYMRIMAHHNTFHKNMLICQYSLCPFTTKLKQIISYLVAISLRTLFSCGSLNIVYFMTNSDSNRFQ